MIRIGCMYIHLQIDWHMAHSLVKGPDHSGPYFICICLNFVHHGDRKQ